MKKHSIFLVSAAFAALLFTGAAARADEPKLIGAYGDWSAYVFMEDGNKVCYMASQPKKKSGSYSKRGDVFALITHRPAEGSKDVFSYIAGYSYKPDSDATVQIDSNNYSLFTQDDTAWAPDAVVDGKIAQAVRTGGSMTVKGTSARGTATVDTFGLKGSGAAHDAISKECDVK